MTQFGIFHEFNYNKVLDLDNLLIYELATQIISYIIHFEISIQHIVLKESAHVLK